MSSISNIQSIIIDAINAKWPEFNARATCLNSKDVVIDSSPGLAGWKLSLFEDRARLEMAFSMDIESEKVDVGPTAYACMMRLRDKVDILYCDPQLVERVISDITALLDGSGWNTYGGIDISKIVEASEDGWADLTS